MKTLRFFLALALLITCAAAAQRTSRGALRAATDASPQAQTAVVTEAADFDTIASPKAHLVDLNGYDKPLRSRRETFFATNNGPATIGALALTLTYYDKANRMLHSTPVKVAVEIPAGQTRQISIKSWDAQQSFYYVRSAVPSRSERATPFDVTINVDTVFCLR